MEAGMGKVNIYCLCTVFWLGVLIVDNLAMLESKRIHI